MATSAAPLRCCPAADDAQIIANITADCDLINHLPSLETRRVYSR
jgi:hypothetical protein